MGQWVIKFWCVLFRYKIKQRCTLPITKRKKKKKNNFCKFWYIILRTQNCSHEGRGRLGWVLQQTQRHLSVKDRLLSMKRYVWIMVWKGIPLWVSSMWHAGTEWPSSCSRQTIIRRFQRPSKLLNPKTPSLSTLQSSTAYLVAHNHWHCVLSSLQLFNLWKTLSLSLSSFWPFLLGHDSPDIVLVSNCNTYP